MPSFIKFGGQITYVFRDLQNFRALSISAGVKRWMSMIDDAELLRRYAEDQSDAAFTELVHRHARTRAEALLASLPESVRAEYGSPEGMTAALEMNTTREAGIRVLSQT